MILQKLAFLTFSLNLPRWSFVLTIVIGLAFFWVAPPSAHAQISGIGLQGTVGALVPGGDAFFNRENGQGFEGVVSWGFNSGLEFGVGVQRSQHDLVGVIAPCDLTAAFAEVRWRFNTASASALKIYPFIGARGGYAHRSINGQFEESGDGFLAGGVAGFEFWVSRRIALTAQGRIDWFSIDRIGPYEQQASETERMDGNMAGAKLGIKIRP